MAKDRTLPPSVVKAAVEARVAGISERAIYETLRERLAVAPSYRDLRAAYREAGVSKRSEATAARREVTEQRVERAKENKSGPDSVRRYHRELAIVREVDQTSDAKEALDEKYLLGYLARAGADPNEIEDVGLRERLESIYDGHGS